MPGEFKIGVAMAGAISAGAYSAGVLDFLIEALEEWEKERGQAGVPDHRVVLAALSGASAGSITAALGMVAASAGSAPTGNRTAKPGQPAYCVLPDLYEAWVAKPDFTLSTVGSLLDDAPLKATPPGDIVALLNTEPLRRIAEQAILSAAARQPKPGPRPYLPAELHLFMTQANLRGVPYEIAFSGAGGSTGYGMLSHGDRAHYVITGIGAHDFTSPWAGKDTPKATLAMNLLPAEAANLTGDWDSFIEDTLASSAFPVGLQARKVSGSTSPRNRRMWPLELSMQDMAALQPMWPPTWSGQPDRLCPSAAVDGGTINNEPFEYARFSLRALGSTPGELAPNERDPDKADRTVLMIDPFPEAPEFATDDRTATDLTLISVIRRMLPMFIQQSRFKPEEAVLALRQDVASRWLIAPRRYVNNVLQPDGIACGLLGGFGGFADREFREHDFELGRRNCQDFLRKWFGVTQTNLNVDGANALTLPITAPGQPGQPASTLVGIIPLCGTADTPVAVRPWPRVTRDKLDRIVDAAARRAEVLVPRVVAEQVRTRPARWGIGLVWNTFGRARARTFILYSMLADLVRRDQFQPTANLPSREHRLVLAACIDPAYDFVTDGAIVRDLNLAPAAVGTILADLEGQKFLTRYKGGQDIRQPAYTYSERAPGWIWTIPGFRSVREYFNESVIKY